MAGLSAGITSVVLILIFIRYERNFDTYHKLSKNTFRVVQHSAFPDETVYWNTTAYPLAEALRSDFSEFMLVTQASGPDARTFSIHGDHGQVDRYEEKHVLFVDEWFPQVFDLNWLAGNPATAFSQPESIVLTESIAQKFFPEKELISLIGKTVLLNGKDPILITGVVRDAPGNTNLRYNILVAYTFFKRHNNYYAHNWSGNYQGTTFVVIKDPTTAKTVEEKITTWKKKYLKPEDDKKINYLLQPLNEIHNETLYGSSPGSYTMPVSILHAAWCIALFIIIIASANFINLATAQAATRAKEIGIRKIVGGTRKCLIFRFLGENFILIAITMVISIALIQLVLPKLNSILSIINMRLFFHWYDLTIVFSVGVVVMILAAVYPAVAMTVHKPVDVLQKKALTLSNRSIPLRKTLIVLQFTIVQFFIAGTLVIASQMKYMTTKDLGFNRDGVIVVKAPPADKLESFQQAILLNNRIEDVSFGSGPPASIYGIQYGTSYRLPNQTEEEGKPGEMKVGDLNYLSFYKLELLTGRNFTSIKHPFDEFIVNEKLITSLGWTPDLAIGQSLTINEGQGKIVGVVKDFHNTSLQEEITACVMINWSVFQELAFIKVNSGSGLQPSLDHIEHTWKEFNPEGVFTFAFLDDLMMNNYAVENLVFKGFTFFSILAISIGCLGILGLISFIALKRKKEVGIRKVLGASTSQIVALLSKEFVWLVIFALILALPVAHWVMDEWLSGFKYHVDLEWWFFAGSGCIGIIITILTISFESVRTALSNPVNAIRNE